MPIIQSPAGAHSPAPAGQSRALRTRGIKAKGRSAESAVVDLARRSGWPHAERRRLEGVQDRGDIAGMPGVVVEVKSGARLALAEWMAETERERANDGADFGLLAIKPKGVDDTRVEQWYGVLPLGALLELLALAGYGDDKAVRDDD